MGGTKPRAASAGLSQTERKSYLSLSSESAAEEGRGEAWATGHDLVSSLPFLQLMLIYCVHLNPDPSLLIPLFLRSAITRASYVSVTGKSLIAPNVLFSSCLYTANRPMELFWRNWWNVAFLTFICMSVVVILLSFFDRRLWLAVLNI